MRMALPLLFGDAIETQRDENRVLASTPRKLPVSSTKSMTGHLLGGAGGLEAGISVLALRDQILPPTINYETPDPACDLDYIPNKARKAEVEYVLSNSFGFGGTNAALVFQALGRAIEFVARGRLGCKSCEPDVNRLRLWKIRENCRLRETGSRERCAARDFGGRHLDSRIRYRV